MANHDLDFLLRSTWNDWCAKNVDHRELSNFKLLREISRVEVTKTEIEAMRYDPPEGFDIDGNGKLSVKDLSKLHIESGCSDMVVNESSVDQEATFLLSSTIGSSEEISITDTVSKTQTENISMSMGSLFGLSASMEFSVTNEHSESRTSGVSKEVTWEKSINLTIPAYTIIIANLFIYRAKLEIPFFINLHYTGTVFHGMKMPKARNEGLWYADIRSYDVDDYVKINGVWKGEGVINSHISIKEG